MFSESQLHRYSRQIVLQGFGPKAQQKLLDSRVLVIGAGGLGSSALLYLAAAGVGTIGIADFDKVDISNLQRQILYCEDDIGKLKAKAASFRIVALNSDVKCVEYVNKISAKNILVIIAEYDFIIDATDTLKTKLLINDACVLAKKPFCHAGALGFSGQVMTVIPYETTCLRCVIDHEPQTAQPTCSQAGIIGAVVGVLGTLQALEAIKYLTQTGYLLTNSVLSFQGDMSRFHTLPLEKKQECEVCGINPEISIVKFNQRDIEKDYEKSGCALTNLL